MAWIKLIIAIVFFIIIAMMLKIFSKLFKIDDSGYDNPISIGIVMSLLLVFISYIPSFKLVTFFISMIIIIIFIKEFYKITIVKSCLLLLSLLITLSILFGLFLIIT